MTWLITKLGTKIGVFAFAGLLVAFLGASATATVLFYQKQAVQTKLESADKALENAQILITQCKTNKVSVERIAHERQARLDALNKSVRSDRLRAESARCIPIAR